MGASAAGNSLPSPCTSESCVISLIDFAPVSVIATFISFSIRFSRLATPAWPAVASAYKKARPSSTVSAPSAIIRTTSSPLRIPLSARMAISPFTASAIAGSARAEESTPSSWRPPWLETTIPSAPKRTASRASSGSRIPLITIGPSQKSRIHSRSFHEMDGSKLFPSQPM